MGAIDLAVLRAARLEDESQGVVDRLNTIFSERLSYLTPSLVLEERIALLKAGWTLLS